MPLRRFIEGDGDDRQDDVTRGRIREIQAGLVAWADHIEHRQWATTALTILMIVGGMLATGVGYAILQGQRWTSTRDICERSNRQADATVAILLDVHARRPVVDSARIRLPHVPPLAHREGSRVVVGPAPGYNGPMSCSDVASDIVGPFRL
jgi:hypothetical protein